MENKNSPQFNGKTKRNLQYISYIKQKDRQKKKYQNFYQTSLIPLEKRYNQITLDTLSWISTILAVYNLSTVYHHWNCLIWTICGILAVIMIIQYLTPVTNQAHKEYHYLALISTIITLLIAGYEYWCITYEPLLQFLRWPSITSLSISGFYILLLIERKLVKYGR